jgi:CelD/BcsL family acetyltransferase involved in cellulose biosynthesis
VSIDPVVRLRTTGSLSFLGLVYVYSLPRAMGPQLLSISDLTDGDLRAWKKLATRAVSPNPFAEAEFVLPAARGWDLDDVQLLVVADGDAWLAALPVRSLRSWRGVPGRCLAGWRHSYCFLGTPLVAAERARSALTALIGAGISVGTSFALDWIDADGPLVDDLSLAVRTSSRIVTLERFERAALHRRSDRDYLGEAVSPHHRREFKRARRRLEREIGSLVVRERSGDVTAYHEFLALERSGWKGRAGTAMACNPRHSEFFIAMCEQFAEAGRLQLLSLGSDERVVAMKCNLVAGHITYCFKIAFDEQVAKLSPGIQLELANIERFHESGAAWADSCADPDNAMINRLWPDRRRLQSIVVTRRDPRGALPSLKWRAAAAALPLRRRAIERIRSRASGH